MAADPDDRLRTSAAVNRGRVARSARRPWFPLWTPIERRVRTVGHAVDRSRIVQASEVPPVRPTVDESISVLVPFPPMTRSGML